MQAFREGGRAEGSSRAEQSTVETCCLLSISGCPSISLRNGPLFAPLRRFHSQQRSEKRSRLNFELHTSCKPAPRHIGLLGCLQHIIPAGVPNLMLKDSGGLDSCAALYHNTCMTGVDTMCLIASSTPAGRSKFKLKEPVPSICESVYNAHAEQTACKLLY